jgi:hypothetical protein
MLASLAFLTATPACAQQQPQKPNILVIMGDDIGYWNISAYNRGMMGYRTPNSFRQRRGWRRNIIAIYCRRGVRRTGRPGGLLLGVCCGNACDHHSCE